MSLKTALAREAYVAIHAQTLRFRLVKYAVLITIAAYFYVWTGWSYYSRWIFMMKKPARVLRLI